MASLRIECLRCGDLRVVSASFRHRLDAGECPRCAYVGWAASAELDEPVRRRLRSRPPELRRLSVA
jgi:hypothetical protein